MLFLDIESYHKNTTEHPVSMQLQDGVLTIGRDPMNNWCLPDPGRVLSKQHCKIEQLNGQYQLTDTSTNGVFVNDSAEPLGRGNSAFLQNGDRIRLSDYEIRVKLEEVAQGVSPVAPQPVPPPAPQPQVAPPPPVSSEFEGQDWKAILEGGGQSSVPEGQGEAQAVDVPELTQSHYDAPSVGMSIPENWGQEQTSPVADNMSPGNNPEATAPGPIPDNFMDIAAPAASGNSGEHLSQDTHTQHQDTPFQQPVAPEPVANSQIPADFAVSEPSPEPSPELSPEPVAVAASAEPFQPPPVAGSQLPPSQSNELLMAFLQGAGLDNMAINESPEQMMREVGSLFRKVTMGLMGVLAARGDIKSEFRLSQTMIKPMENNPLKFSLNINEAMVALLNKKGQGYMAAEDAFDEAFEDLKGHQIAVLTGMQSALKSLLERLDPANIQGQDSEVTGVKKLLGGQKAQYWDDFVLLYKTLFQKTEDDFQTVFGHEFAKAYEEQIRKHKSHD